MKKILLCLIALVAFSCKSSSTQGNLQSQKHQESQEVQLNISILLDLSDRINSQKSPAIPEHCQRDIEIIKTVIDFFKKDMRRLNAWKAKGKIKVFFSPPPADTRINNIAKELNIDCSLLDNKGKKNVYDSITSTFTKNLTSIYNQTIAANSWDGSDIWRFFKTDVKNYCVDDNPDYRNILIILTDGYIYHIQSQYKNGNRYSFLLDKNIGKYRRENWQQMVEQDDFGIMATRNDLQDLEVLVLELSAERQNNKIDEDILTFVWEKWLKEMNVSNYGVYSSDLPVNTKIRIDRFLKNPAKK
ncbi:MAG: hypothetical protein LBG17_06895 [Bacteroidales bacterium]|jgi:hypothetical protein|nr:hypothetical protein [Bacteroidales bacterium]